MIDKNQRAELRRQRSGLPVPGDSVVLALLDSLDEMDASLKASGTKYEALFAQSIECSKNYIHALNAERDLADTLAERVDYLHWWVNHAKPSCGCRAEEVLARHKAARGIKP